jgi:excisionase family DNA binding protein
MAEPIRIPDALLKSPEVCRIARISPRTLYQLVKDGKLPAVRFGRAVRFDPKDVATLIQSGKTGGRP